MKKSILYILIVLAALAGIFIVINNNKKKNQAQTDIVAQKNSAVAVKAAKVEYKDMDMGYTNNGVFAPKQEVMLASEVAGRVEQLLVKEGDRVGAGQVLAIIKGDKQNVNLSNAKAAYAQALTEAQRFESSYTSGGVTKQQLDQVKLQLENAKNNLRSAEIMANDVKVKASFPGIVNKRMIEPGSYVNPGQQMFEVVNVNTLKLKVNVDEKSIGLIKLGQVVDVYSTVIPDKTFSGVVTFIAPKADGSLNFPVELEIKNNADNLLKAGMYGTAQFGANQTVKALVVPRSSFVGNVSSNKVFVIKDNVAILTNVVVGRNFGDFIEIISGVEEGALVVTTGQINLNNETPIQIID